MGPESNFYHAVSLAADIVIVNILMVVTSLPIVTIGPSLRAGSVVITQLIAEEGSSPARTYFSELKKHWVPSTIWGLVVVALLLLARYEVSVIDHVGLGAVGTALKVGLVSGIIIIAGISLWFFYLEAIQPKRFLEAFHDAAITSILQLPRTLCGLAMLGVPILILTLVPERFMVVTLFYLIIGVSLTLYLFALLARSAR